MLAATTEQKKSLAIGCTAHAIQDGLGAATYVLLPILAQAFGFNYAQVGLFKGAKELAQALLELYSGVLCERIGAIRSLVMGLTLAGLGYASLAYVNQPGIILICLLFVGVGTAFQHAPASALVSDAFASGGRRGALGLYNSSGDVGKLAFAACFSLAISAGIAWQQVAFSYGLFALAAAFAIGLTLQSASHQTTTTRKATAPSRNVGTSSYWGIIDRRPFITLLIIISLDNIVQAGVLVFAAFAMIAKGLPLPVATMAAVAILAGGIFGKAGCGYLAQSLGVRRAFVLIQVATVMGLVLLMVAPAWVAFALLVPLGVVSQGSTSITYGLIPDLIHPDRLARGYGLMYSLTSFSAAAGPFTFGLVADQFGISMAFYAMAILSLVSVIPMMLFRVPDAVLPEGKRMP